MSKKKFLKSSVALLMSALIIASGAVAVTASAAEIEPEIEAPGFNHDVTIVKFDIASTGTTGIRVGTPVTFDILCEGALKNYDSYNSAYLDILDENENQVARMNYNDQVLTWTPTASGKYYADFHMSDYYGGYATEKKEFEVMDNLNAELVTLVDYEDWLIRGDTVTLVANGTGGRERLEYQFACVYVGSDGQHIGSILQEYAPGNRIEFTFDKAGTYTFSVTVKDAYGETVTASKALTVRNPQFIYSFATPAKATIGQKVFLSSWLTNDRRGFGVRYDITGNGNTTTINHEDLGSKVSWNPTEAGTYEVKATIVKDNQEWGTPKTFTVEVTESDLDIDIETSKATADYVAAGLPIDINVYAKGGTGNYTYNVTCKFFGNPSNALTKISDTKYVLMPEGSGPYYITAKVTDTLGNTVTKEIYFSSDEAYIKSFKAKTQGAKVGDPITLETKAIGMKSHVTYGYTVNNGTTTTTLLATGATAIWTPEEAGTYTVTVTEYYDGEAVDTKELTYTVAPLPVTNNTVTIYYKGFAAPKIQYQIDSEEWSEPVAMTKVSGIDGVTHKYTINMGTAKESTVRFVNGSGKLDDLGGQNYTFAKGMYIYNNGTISSFKNRKAMTENTFKTDIQAEATSVALGNKVKINCTSEGGTGNYQYTFMYRAIDSASWTTTQKADAKSDAKILLKSEGKYVVCVKAMDGSGTIIKKYFVVNVYGQVQIAANISAEKIKLGETVTVNVAGANGSGSYHYAVYYKKNASEKYSTVQNFAKNSVITVEPKGATVYEIIVKVKDVKTGSVTSERFELTVVR